ncbi:unnamed protein product [Urochloa decumbens]|uniref:Uncharacterized protein n=1 Tax=Urochloa decumbens TaxID=240449 RepID=A0ABC8W9M0_9POAL
MEGLMVSVSTGVINSVLKKFTTLLEEYKLIKDVNKDITSLRDEMSSMNALLVKMSNMEELDVQQQEWRNKVRELAYDTEDCIDIFMHKLGDGDVKKGLLHQLKALKACYNIANLIVKLKSRAVEVCDHRYRYMLDDGMSGSSGHRAVAIDPRIQALYVETSNLVGIDEPRNKIIKWLVEEKEGAHAHQLKVVSIVGSGGMGKTTLANQVYIKCKQQFDCTAFISVSQNPNLVKVLTNILSEVGYQLHCLYNSQRDDVGQLIEILRRHLQDKRYLFVIDDIWKPEAWNIIKCSFVENNLGSRVITTTRIEELAKICCSSLHDRVYKIDPLNVLDSRKLFHRRICVSEDACPDQLIRVPNDIIEKCGGVPLAILSVASIVANHEEVRLEKTWEKINNFLGMQLETSPYLEWMRHVIHLSYNDLSLELKTCMLYLGIFPEDHKIMKDDLIKRWMAEGFVGEKHGWCMEKAAEDYFNELINRNIIQIDGYDDCGEVISCRLHDVMLDFIISKSIEENFITIINDQHSTKGSFEIRRLSVKVKSSGCDHLLANMALTQARSFNFWGPAQQMCSLSKFQLLRVLCLDVFVSKDDQYAISNISNLFQLRYLRTRGIECKKLLPQLQTLQYLKTLEILEGDGKGRLQVDIRKLSSTLWHLTVPETVEFFGGIARMRALRTLATLRLTDEESIKEIGELSNLRDLKLELSGTSGLLLPSLCRLGACNLQSLTIHLGFFSKRRDILTCWSPPPHQLHRFHVLDCPFSVVPEWIALLDKLSSLEIEVVAVSRDGIEVLASLPSLLHLRLHVQDHAPEEGVVIHGTAFQNLKEFWFRYKVPCLTFEAGAMPRLHCLSMECYGYGHKVGQDDTVLAGIEHLGSIKVFKLQIYRWKNNYGRYHASIIVTPKVAHAHELQELEMQNLLDALRRAVSKHPGSPQIILETKY